MSWISPFGGARIKALGVGPDPIPQKQLTAERLADTIKTAVIDPGIKQRARSYGAAIRRHKKLKRAKPSLFNWALEQPGIAVYRLVCATARLHQAYFLMVPV
ncbi:MAG: hypothetical protein M5U34_47005 [Chloroflexi bacterium]|nr:hypothetical protein [Chloroflexota bacterium]